MTRDFFEPVFAARPSLKDFILFFLRGFAGYGGSPGGHRSIDGRYSFRVQRGSLSPRLEIDDVFHEVDHGFVEHLDGSDHGALRWSMLGGRGPSETSDDDDDEPCPRDVSGAVWECLSEFASKTRSLSNVVLKATEKAIVGRCIACSRLIQFYKCEGRRGRKLDFVGSDVRGVQVEGWEEALVARVRACSAELRRAKENEEAAGAAADVASRAMEVDAAAEEEKAMDDDTGGGGAGGGGSGGDDGQEGEGEEDFSDDDEDGDDADDDDDDDDVFEEDSGKEAGDDEDLMLGDGTSFD